MNQPPKPGRRWARGAVLAALLASLGVAGQTAEAAASTAPAGDRDIYEGKIDGAKYKVVVPKGWNRTLVLYSHGYYPKGFDFPGGFALSNHPQTAEWLLDHGYALAASEYKGKYGYAVEPALTDQLALLDWFDTKIGKPRRMVTSGQSMGATVSTLLAERNPGRFDGVATVCGGYDFNGQYNMALDVNFATKTLLAPGEDIDLVRLKDPQTSAKALADAIDRGLKTRKGRARLALTGALGNVADWFSTYDPKPTALTDRIRQQAEWVKGAYTLGNGPPNRAELEQRAGGNVSFNAGVDYGHQLARSGKKDLVRKAYKAAGLSLRRDLAKLATTPRIKADPAAVRYMHKYGVVRGTTPAPAIALHNTGDGGAPADAERWYASQVRRHGDPAKLRQAYVNRGSHCAFTASEEIVALRTLLVRVETGKWPATSPKRLNDAASGYAGKYQIPLDILTGKNKVVKPAFARFTPDPFLRPSR